MGRSSRGGGSRRSGNGTSGGSCRGSVSGQPGAELARMAVGGPSLARWSGGKVRAAPFCLHGGRRMPDFVTLLTEDHRRVEQLFKQYDETADPAVALEVCLELSVHST